jgi:hypothetical protein
MVEVAAAAAVGTVLAQMSVELLQVVKALTAAQAQQVQTFLQAVAVVQPLWVVVQQVQQLNQVVAAQDHRHIHRGD